MAVVTQIDGVSLVGRSAELKELDVCLADTRVRSVTVIAPAGAGRTALLDAWCERLSARRILPFRIVATRSCADLPLGAFAGLPGWHHALTGDNDELQRMANAVSIARRADIGIRHILVVDDAHLLDPLSATLVQQLADTRRVLVVASVRSGVSMPDAIAALWRDDHARRLDLAPLSTESLSELIANALAGYVDAGSVRRMHDLCDGHLGYLVELVRAGQRDGSIYQHEGVWYLGIPDFASPWLEQLVAGTVETVSGAQRELLDALAIAERLSADQLARLGFASSDIEALENRRMIVAARTDLGIIELSVRAPVVADVLRRAMPPGKARALAAQLAGAFAEELDDPVRVARWRLQGGGGEPSELVRGASAAAERHEHGLALELADAAVAAGAGFETRLLAARMSALTHGPEAAADRLLALLHDAVSDEERGRIAVAQLDNFLMSTTRRREAMEIVEATKSLITDPCWRDRVEALRIAGSVLPSQGPKAGGEAALALIESSPFQAARVTMYFPAAYSLTRLGRLQAALGISERGLQEHLELDEPVEWQPWHHLWARAETLRAAGRLAEANTLALDHYRLALDTADVEARAWFARSLANQGLIAGHLPGAVAYARESVSLFSQLGKPHQSAWAALVLSMSLALTGQPDAAQATLARGMSRVDPAFNTQVDALAAHAWIEVSRGHLSEGRRLLAESARHGRDSGDLVGAISALHDLARLGGSRESLPELEELAGVVEGDLAQTRLSHVRGLAARNGELMLVASKSFAEMGADLFAAEAAFDAAVAYHKRDNVRAAAAAERRALALATLCKGALTPGLSRVDTRTTLTPAELETARLAAGGHTNREIAGIQFLSIRTVQNRLQSIYMKLGVSGRTDLPEVLQARFGAVPDPPTTHSPAGAGRAYS